LGAGLAGQTALMSIFAVSLRVADHRQSVLSPPFAAARV
jgi:hypothetical protein